PGRTGTFFLPWGGEEGGGREMRCSYVQTAKRPLLECVAGEDEIVFTEETREDGVVVDSFFFDGVYEYERTIRVPGKAPIALTRCLGNEWKEAPPGTTRPQGRFDPACQHMERQ